MLTGRPGSIARIGPGVWLALLLASLPAVADTSADLLKRGRDAFEYGDFKRTSDVLAGVPESGELTEAERIEAWRLLGLSHFFLNRIPEADNAFFGLLKQNPDYQLDPFFVPPNAVAFFDDVRKRNEPYLAPIRDRRRARIEALEQEERLRVEADRRRREELSKPTAPMIVERRFQESSRLVALMPLGLGQFQNGRPGLGATVMSTQLVAAATSVGAYWLVEALRGPGGKFAAASYDRAQAADAVKWWSAGLFYALWLAGVIEANVNFVPSRVVGELPQPNTPAPARAP